MRFRGLAVAVLLNGCAATSVLAVEGATIAGPVGGTDIRSAQLPPPGLYAGGIALWANAFDFVDGNGRTIPALSDANLTKKIVAPFLYYVPEYRPFDGAIGIGVIVPVGSDCGRLFAGTAKGCLAGVGDPYVEVAWSRSFGRFRPSRFAGALPIFEGLSVAIAFGAVLPLGRYDPVIAAARGNTIGNNVYDFAPSVALTYTTAPILAEGTEFSTKIYWNNYLTNPATQYRTGSLINADFAVTERIGRLQMGPAGFYVAQIADDRLSGVAVAPDGRRAETLSLGGVFAYDMPEHNVLLKMKTLTTVFAANTVRSSSVTFGLFFKVR